MFSSQSWKSRRERELFSKSHKSRKEREILSQNLENREEKEKWKYNSPAQERKIWVISSRNFLEIETLVNDCSGVGARVSCRDTMAMALKNYKTCTKTLHCYQVICTLHYITLINRRVALHLLHYNRNHHHHGVVHP